MWLVLLSEVNKSTFSKVEKKANQNQRIEKLLIHLS